MTDLTTVHQWYSHYGDGHPLVYQTYERDPRTLPIGNVYRTPDDGFTWAGQLQRWRLARDYTAFHGRGIGFHFGKDTERALFRLATEEALRARADRR